MSDSEIEQRIGPTAALFVRGAANGNTSPRVTHPDAKAARNVFDRALETGDTDRMRDAFEDLFRVCGALETTMETMARLWVEKRPAGDTAALERVATAAIRLAEQVVHANQPNDKATR